MDKKQINKAVEILIAHNEWRRGADTPHTNPKELGDAIDTVVKALSQTKEVEPKKEVGLEELRELFEDWYFLTEESCLTHGKEFNHNSIFDFFKPHLQKPVESDAMEFAEWLYVNGWIYLSIHKEWINEKLHKIRKTQELYEQFKQLKK